MSIVKNYILIIDACNSSKFLVWREEDHALTLLGKDFNEYVGISSALISDGPSLGMLIGDDESNLQMLQYCPRYDTFFSKSHKSVIKFFSPTKPSQLHLLSNTYPLMNTKQ